MTPRRRKAITNSPLAAIQLPITRTAVSCQRWSSVVTKAAMGVTTSNPPARTPATKRWAEERGERMEQSTVEIAETLAEAVGQHITWLQPSARGEQRDDDMSTECH